ncbi:ribosome maturation factor RimM [Hyphomonas oceanitis]|uniref:ribosome maturation factor RimM n=1 Tax=Hyphomonas oceanitis TaxID=81033 RepID=UPI00300161F1
MTSKSQDKLIVVGALKGAHGVRGEVRVKSFTAEPEDLFTYGPLTDAAGRVLLTPLSARPGNDHFIVATREQKQKEEWDALKGALLHVARAQLPEAEEDEFYIEDLVGLDVVSEGDAVAGRVKSVQNFGADDLLEVQLVTGGHSVFVPFTLADVPEIDFETRRVSIPDLASWSEPEPDQ